MNFSRHGRVKISLGAESKALAAFRLCCCHGLSITTSKNRLKTVSIDAAGARLAWFRRSKLGSLTSSSCMNRHHAQE